MGDEFYHPSSYSDDEDEETEINLAEMEAMLYSKIHHEESYLENEDVTEVSEQKSESFYDKDISEDVENIDDNSEKPLYEKILEVKGLNEEDHVDSGMCSTASSSPSTDRSKSPIVESLNDDDAQENSRFETINNSLKNVKKNIETVQLDSDSSSSDEEGFVKPESLKLNPGVVDLISSEEDEIQIEEIKIVPKEKMVSSVNSNLSVTSKEQNRNIPHYISASRHSSSDDDELSDPDDLKLNDDELSINVVKLNRSKSCNIAEIINNSATKSVTKTEEKEFQTEPPSSWSNDMIQFYNEIDPEKANLNLENILNNLPGSNSECWKTDRADKDRTLVQNFQRRSGGGRYFTSRRSGGSGKCSNCNEFGHNYRECKEERKIPICSMCCEPNHTDVRCPYSSCLRCGTPNSGLYTSNCFHCRRLNGINCLLCGGQGHVKSKCPDFWRRYHITTNNNEDNSIKIPSSDPHKLPNEIWCPNCAKKGHFLNQCRAYAYSAYPYSILKVIDYSVPYGLNPLNENESKISKKEERKEMKKMKKKSRQINSSADNVSISHPSPKINSTLNKSREEWRERKKLKKLKKKVWDEEQGDFLSKNKNSKKKQIRENEFVNKRKFSKKEKRNNDFTNGKNNSDTILDFGPETTIRSAIKTLHKRASKLNDSPKLQSRIYKEIKMLKKSGIPFHLYVENSTRKKLSNLLNRHND